MVDKRKFHYFLNELKDENEAHIDLIEAIQEKFEGDIKPITEKELKALKQNPLQFVKKIPQKEGEWTSQLHIWAEQGVPEILELDPIYLAFKNSVGDSVLMCLVVSAAGAYTEKIDYKLIEKILDKDLSYVVSEKDGAVEDKNVLDIKDLNGQTIVDFLIDFAFGTGKYQQYLGDTKLQMILKNFSEASNSLKEKTNNMDAVDFNK